MGVTGIWLARNWFLCNKSSMFSLFVSIKLFIFFIFSLEFAINLFNCFRSDSSLEISGEISMNFKGKNLRCEIWSIFRVIELSERIFL